MRLRHLYLQLDSGVLEYSFCNFKAMNKFLEGVEKSHHVTNWMFTCLVDGEEEESQMLNWGKFLNTDHSSYQGHIVPDNVSGFKFLSKPRTNERYLQCYDAEGKELI